MTPKERAKAWYEANKDRPEFKARKAAYQKEYLGSEQGRETLNRWRAQHSEELKQYAKDYAQTPKGRAAISRAGRKRQLANRKLIDEAKSRPCMDCGKTFPTYAMDLDHRPGEDKHYCVSKMLGGWSVTRLAAEIAKCDVVCAICHRKRTHERGQYT